MVGEISSKTRDPVKKHYINVKYGGKWGGWCSNEVNGPYRVGLWKHIKKRMGKKVIMLIYLNQMGSQKRRDIL